MTNKTASDILKKAVNKVKTSTEDEDELRKRERHLVFLTPSQIQRLNKKPVTAEDSGGEISTSEAFFIPGLDEELECFGDACTVLKNYFVGIDEYSEEWGLFQTNTSRGSQLGGAIFGLTTNQVLHLDDLMDNIILTNRRTINCVLLSQVGVSVNSKNPIGTKAFAYFCDDNRNGQIVFDKHREDGAWTFRSRSYCYKKNGQTFWIETESLDTAPIALRNVLKHTASRLPAFISEEPSKVG